MRELLARNFNKVYPFAKKKDCFNTVFSIIEGTTRGRIWVDHLSNPSIIFVWDTEKRFYLIGDYSKSDQISDLNRILVNIVIEYGINHKFNQWTFRYKPDEWQPTLL
ncbi:MAG: hypothetical protein BAJALOKI2v1_110044 [Promethearchaeota archaeon]|nr:MAG: hypothetical protein BAJALOKI2v1_110044 [Candidatus Lokiarchaeota archaeon]